MKNKNYSYATQEAYCSACSMLLLLALQSSPAIAKTSPDDSPPPINMTVMGSLGGGTDRTYAIGPHDAALVLEKVGGKYKVVGEIGGGVYHLMGQEVDLTRVRYFESFGLTEADVNQFYQERRAALDQFKMEHAPEKNVTLNEDKTSSNEQSGKTSSRKTRKKKADLDEDNSGTWKTVAVKLDPDWETKHSSATVIAMSCASQPDNQQMEEAREALLNLARDSKLSKWEIAASINNAANVLYLQRKYKDAAALYKSALAKVQNESGTFISPVPGKILSNAWKANRASRLSDDNEKQIPVIWIKSTDANMHNNTSARRDVAVSLRSKDASLGQQARQGAAC